MTSVPGLQPVNERGYTLPLNWVGLLPYPSAEDFPTVPEPSTFVLGGFGLLALGHALVWRRKGET
jgi:MYXO-CTERM domain-containing protein